MLGTRPRRVPPHVFALDARRLRYAGFPAGNGAPRLTTYHSVELPPELFGSGAMGGAARDGGALRERLGELLERIAAPVEEASLVLPDSWVRVAFADVEELPRGAAARAEVLRFKLRRLVPFRVEDLRLEATPVASLGDREARRVLLLFGVEAALSQLEGLFAERGIRIGHIGNETLAVLVAVREAVANLDLAGLVHLARDGYSLVLVRYGEPIVYRLKVAPPGAGTGRPAHVLRDLKLTRKFLQEQLRDVRLRRLFLASDEEDREGWSARLQEVFGVPVDPVAARWAPASGVAPPAPFHEVAPLFGAACRMI